MTTGAILLGVFSIKKIVGIFTVISEVYISQYKNLNDNPKPITLNL